VSQTGVVTRLAVRELWITFRMLILLAAYVGAGAVVAVLPAPPSATLGWLALGLAAATVIGAAIAAEGLATERVLGRAGWLVTRSISRGTFLAGWFLAIAVLTVVGLGAAAVLGWVAISTPLPPAEPLEYVSVMGGVAAIALVGVALGLVIGSVFRPVWAALAAALLTALLLAGVELFVAPGWLPMAMLAHLADAPRSLGTGLRAAGIGLGVAAVATLLARLALSRAEL
jgi:hypothetical protein